MFQAPRPLLIISLFAFFAACAVPGGQNTGAPGSGQPLARSTDAAILAPEAAPLEAQVMAAPAMIIAPPQSPRATNARAGVVTAGDIDDTLNLGPFLRYQNTAASELSLPKAATSRPLLAQVRGPLWQPAAGARVTLRVPGAAAPFYDGYSGVDGMVTVFPAVLGQSRLRSVEMRVFPDGNAPAVVTTLATGMTRHIVTLPREQTWSPDFLDLVFVVDTTGSMGDELTWLAQEIQQIAATARRAAPGIDIRFGLVVYKAPADNYVVRSYGFTDSPRSFARWVASERASGGAGGPEVVADALSAATQMNWRRGRGERLIFQIGDEPPSAVKTQTYYRAAQTAAANGIQIFGVAASGVEGQLEYLMRQGAVMTGGRYLFLTDDSGVGLAHAEPTISCYRVTRLNQLMENILRSELSGRRVEARPADVIREVGSYQNGRCLN